MSKNTASALWSTSAGQPSATTSRWYTVMFLLKKEHQGNFSHKSSSIPKAVIFKLLSCFFRSFVVKFNRVQMPSWINASCNRMWKRTASSSRLANDLSVGQSKLENNARNIRRVENLSSVGKSKRPNFGIREKKENVAFCAIVTRTEFRADYFTVFYCSEIWYF